MMTQERQKYDREFKQKAVELCLVTTLQILSTVIILLKDRFKSAEIIFNALPVHQYKDINQWYHLAISESLNSG